MILYFRKKMTKMYISMGLYKYREQYGRIHIRL